MVLRELGRGTRATGLVLGEKKLLDCRVRGSGKVGDEGEEGRAESGSSLLGDLLRPADGCISGSEQRAGGVEQGERGAPRRGAPSSALACSELTSVGGSRHRRRPVGASGVSAEPANRERDVVGGSAGGRPAGASAWFLGGSTADDATRRDGPPSRPEPPPLSHRAAAAASSRPPCHARSSQ
jgi:hypothetical protein